MDAATMTNRISAADTESTMAEMTSRLSNDGVSACPDAVLV